MFIDIIGGSGFIGSRLVKRLKLRNKGSVKIIDKVISQVFADLTKIGDVRAIDDLRKHITENSVVINLAAEHRDDVRPLNLYDEVNVRGAKNICAIAREKQIKKIIFTSTVAVYGFAPVGTNESGKIAPFNDYGRTKFEAEQIFKEWQAEDPNVRSLVIIRPTVVFGEQNRGNVYNLLRQIASGKFIMIGQGKNKKSMVYVENLAAFIEFCLEFKPGLHIYNFIDKPDFTMNELVGHVKEILGKSKKIRFRLPVTVGHMLGKTIDFIGKITCRRFAISSIRVKKFCSDSIYNTAIAETGFIPEVSMEKAFAQTVRYEFLESNEHQGVFYTE